jgi:hypothetical protein
MALTEIGDFELAIADFSAAVSLDSDCEEAACSMRGLCHFMLECYPEALADCFDGWGRPLPEKWRERRIDVPDPDANIILSGSSWSQSQKVLELMAQEAGRFGPADVSLGVPDSEVIPFLETDLAEAAEADGGDERGGPDGRARRRRGAL